MNCGEFERRLQHLLDERKQKLLREDDLPAPMQIHLKDCGECANLVSGYRALLATLSASHPGTSAFRAANVIELTTAAPHRLGRFRSLAPLATAAVLLIATFMVYQYGAPATVKQARIEQPIFVPSYANSPPQEHALTTVASSSRPTLYPSMEINERSLGLMLNLAGLSPVTFSAELLDSHLFDRPAWMVQVSDGLKPVTERMTGTLNALLQALPGADAAKEGSQGARYNRYYPCDPLA
jgi:hypothetical protein